MWTRPQSKRPMDRCGSLLVRAVLGMGIALSAGSVFAQTPAGNGPEFPAVESAPQALPGAEYWIASSRACCQRQQTRCPRGTLNYFAADAANRLTRIAEPAFLASLNFNVPVCFVIHGDRTSFRDVHRVAPEIVKWIRASSKGLPVQVVFYTWPSDDEQTPLPPISITARGERAEFNGCYLAKLVSQFPANARVSFFGYSFGARVVASTLHLLAGGAVPGCNFRCPAVETRSYRAVLVAAAMDRNWLNPGERYGQALWVTEWLLNMRNQSDFALNLYPIRTFYGKQALGRVGFSPRDRFLMGPLASRLTEWDVTWAIRTEHAWVFYYHNREIGSVVAPALVFAAGQQTAPGVQLGESRSTDRSRSRILRHSER